MKFDFIRCLAIIFVICIHSMAIMDAAIAEGSAGIGVKLIGGILNSIIHSGVPLFLMLSGSLLLGKKEPVKLFFYKRLKRILVPFFIWSLFVFMLSSFKDFRKLGCGQLISTFFYKFLTEGTFGIYWYVYAIIGLYLITPVLRVYFGHADKKMAYYFGGILVLITSASQLFPSITIFSRFSSLNLDCLTYFIIGYIINQYVVKEKNIHKYSLIGLVLAMLGGFVNEVCRVDSNFPWIFFTSIFLFSTLVSNKKIEILDYNLKLGKIVNFISSTSYGIYLSHFLFISVLIKLGFASLVPLSIEPICMTLIVLMIDVLFMYVVKKIKVDKILS